MKFAPAMLPTATSRCSLYVAASQMNRRSDDAVSSVNWLPIDPSDTRSGRSSRCQLSVLSSLAQIARGLAELRKLYGTGHRRSSSHSHLSAQRARLAAGTAAAFAEFAVSIWNAELEQTA